MITLLLTSLFQFVEGTAHPKELKDVTWKQTKKDIAEGMHALGDKISEGVESVGKGVKKAAHKAKKGAAGDNFEWHRANLEKAIEKAKKDKTRARLVQIGQDIRQLEDRIKEYRKSYEERYPHESAEKSALIKEADKMLSQLKQLRNSCETHCEC
jgi:hypothetical protein